VVGLYSEGGCAYFLFVLVPNDEICWIPFSEVRGRLLLCTNMEQDTLHQFSSSACGFKKVAPEVAPGFKSSENSFKHASNESKFAFNH